jgi:hypothetical protein
MKKYILALVLPFAVFFALSAHAQQQVFVIGMADWQPYGMSETITVTNSAVSTLTASKYARQSDEVQFAMRKQAYIVVQGAPINYSVDGVSNPTTSSGLPGVVGQWIKIENSPDGSGELTNFKAIATTSTNATLSVTYSRRQ